MCADIAQRRGAQERIADCVRQCVTVGVAHRTLLKRNPHAAENQPSPRGEAVDVIPDADAARILNDEL